MSWDNIFKNQLQTTYFFKNLLKKSCKTRDLCHETEIKLIKK